MSRREWTAIISNTGVRFPVSGETLGDPCHFDLVQQDRFAHLERLPIHPRQGFDLFGQFQRLVEGLSDSHRAMVADEAGAPPLDRRDRRIGQLLGAEGGIGPATDVRAARMGYFLVKSGYTAMQACHGRGVR